MLALEIGVVLLAVGSAFAAPRSARPLFRAFETRLGRIAKRKRLSVLLVGVSALGLRLALLPIYPIPQPFVHDEFSYLLAADTYASGRLTNPTHPMWQHFESFHISHRPTYMSMYFPGQGAVLAFGKAVFGHPWFGVWLSAGLMCSAICWMLQGWLPAPWALLGGMLAVVRLGLFSYWINSYWGGAVPAIGGALVLGAVPRIIKAQRLRHAVLLGCGFAVLAISRPYEGFLVGIAVAVRLAWWMAKSSDRRTILLRVVSPFCLMMLALGGALGYYNWRVFLDPFALPYQLNRAEYAVAKVFIWQDPSPEPVYRHAVMRDFYTRVEKEQSLKPRTPAGFAETMGLKVAITACFVFGAVFAVPLFFLPRVLRDRRIRFLVGTACLVGAGLTVNAWLFPHYLAPIISVFYAVLMQGMRHMRAWRPAGPALVRIVPCACVLLLGIRIAAAPLGIPVPRFPSMWYGTGPLGLQRAEVVSHLEKLAGRHLLIVRYSPEHDPVDDWVYNAARIDASKLVWARDMGPLANEQLIRFFADRQVWLVEPDRKPARLSPYSGAEAHRPQRAEPGTASGGPADPHGKPRSTTETIP